MGNGSGGDNETQRRRGETGRRRRYVGGRGTRGTSKKSKHQGDSPGSSEGDTKEEASVAERTQRTLRGLNSKQQRCSCKHGDTWTATRSKQLYTTMVQTQGASSASSPGHRPPKKFLQGTHPNTPKGRKISRLQGSKISLLLTEI